MRSFIKKLAGAMALTMVVSSVAPAGAVFAASTEGAYVAMQGSEAVVEDITLTLGSKVDFRFMGAPEDWKEQGFKWYSMNEKVATVDQAGIVTANAVGDTKVKIAVGLDWEAEVVIRVKEAVGNPEAPVYVAYQGTQNVVTETQVMVGQKVDFCFINAPENWKEIYDWESTNTAVATVDRAGVVTGVTDGFATINFLLDGVVAASVDVTVGNPAPVVEDPDYVPVYVEDATTLVPYKYVETVDEDGSVYGEYVAYEADENGEYTVTVGETFTLDHGVVLGAEEFYYGEDYDWTWNSEGETEEGEYVLSWIDWNYDIYGSAAVDAVCNYVGKTTVNFKVENENGDVFVATPIVINVVEAAVNYTFDVEPVSDKSVQIIFESASTAAKVLAEGKEELKVVRLGAKGATYKAHIKYLEATEDENILLMTNYIQFMEGVTYRLILNEGTEDERYVDFVVIYGEVDGIKLPYTSVENEMTIAVNKAFADEDGDIEVVLNPQLYSGKINVTDIANYHVEDVTYELVEEDEDISLTDDGILTFTKPYITAYVKVTYIGEDENGNEYTVSEVFDIEAVEAPAYYLEEVVNWTFVGPYQTSINWNKPNQVLRAEDEAYIVALVRDSYGNILVTDHKFDGDNGIPSIYNFKTKFYDENYELVLRSTDMRKLVLDGNEVKTFKAAANAGIIFATLDQETEKEREFDYIEFNIKDARKFAGIKANKSELVLATRGRFTTDTIKFTLVDQYGEKWVPFMDVDTLMTLTSNNKNITATSWDMASGEVTLTFDGKDFEGIKEEKKDLTVLFTAKYGDKTTSFKVVFKTPLSNGRITYGVVATDVDQRIANDVTSTVVSSRIEFFKYQSKIKIDKADPTLIASSDVLDALLKAKKGEVINGTVVEEGAQFLVVYYPDKTVVTEAATISAIGVTKTEAGTNDSIFYVTVGETEASAASDGAAAMKYAPTGKYLVEVLEVTGFKSNQVAKFTKYTDEFSVINTNPTVSLYQAKVTSNKDTVEEMIIDAIQIKLNDTVWNGTTWNTNLLTVDNIVVNRGEYDIIETDDFIVVKNMIVRIPVNNVIDDVYYEVELEDVNMTIKKVQ